MSNIISPSILPLRRLIVMKYFSTTSITYKTPTRPQPTGEFTAHFPQTKEVKYMRERKQATEKRWKRYIQDLSLSAAPRRLAGPDFGSRVRGRSPARPSSTDRDKLVKSDENTK
jgi:hypothetical protein